MKVIDIPSLVVDKQLEQAGMRVRVQTDFKKFLTTAMKQYEPAGQGYEKIVQAVRIVGILKEIQGGIDGNGQEAPKNPVLRLDNDDYKVLSAAVEASSWIPEVAWEYVPFYEAVRGAKDYDPNKVDKAEEKKT